MQNYILLPRKIKNASGSGQSCLLCGRVAAECILCQKLLPMPLYHFPQSLDFRQEKRKKLLARAEEFEDSAGVMEEKCKKLAEAIAKSQYMVVYSGAGVSTAVGIPDYRGSNGIWTRLDQGKDIG